LVRQSELCLFNFHASDTNELIDCPQLLYHEQLRETDSHLFLKEKKKGPCLIGGKAKDKKRGGGFSPPPPSQPALYLSFSLSALHTTGHLQMTEMTITIKKHI